MLKTLLKFKIIIHYSPLIHQASHLVVEGYQVDQHDFPFINPCVLLSDILLSLMRLEMVSRRICSITFPQIKVMLTACMYFPRYSFLPFLKIEMEFSFFQSSGITSWSPQPFKDDNEWPHNANSLSIQGCILSGPMDLCMSSSFKHFLSWSCSVEGKSTFLQTFPWVWGSWYSSGQF